jgi:PEP-CTERM motif
MGRLVWAALLAAGALATAGSAGASILACTTGCTVSGGFYFADYTVPSDGQAYRWDLWTDTPGVTINLASPNETFDTEIVSNGDGTFHNDIFLLGTGYAWNEIQAPSHTTIYARSLQADFNHCSSSSPAGDICAASFNVWGNGSFLTVDSGNPVTVFFSQTAVPEPATWALMLSGFFGLGLALRRRSGAMAAAA